MSTHTCHAPGCGIPVPPRLFMCRTHWRMLPPSLRERIWATYRPGQENDKQPSGDYLDAARRAVEYLRSRS